MQSLATEITVSSLPPKILAKQIIAASLIVDQLIYRGTWGHVGLATGAQLNQVLMAAFT
jgi:hypothetical protein